MGLLSLGGMLCWVIGVLRVVKVRVVLSLPFILGMGGFSLTCMAFICGSF